MKRAIAIAILWMLIITGSALASGSSFTITSIVTSPAIGGVYSDSYSMVVTTQFTGDSSTGVVPSLTIPNVKDMYLGWIEIIPGTITGSGGFIISDASTQGTGDILSGQASSKINSSFQYFNVGWIPAMDNNQTITITNSTASATGIIRLYYRCN